MLETAPLRTLPVGHQYPWRAPAFLLAAMVALACVVYAIDTGQASFLAFYLIGLLAGTCLTLATTGYGDPTARNIHLLFLVVYSVNAILVMAFAYVLTDINGAPYASVPAGVIPDDERFYGYGVTVANAWLSGTDAELPIGIKFLGYPYFLGACLYVGSFFGDMSPVAPRLLNAMFGALLAVTVYRIAWLVYADERISRGAMVLTAVFPVFAYYSAMLFRDIIVAYLIALAVLLFLEVSRQDATRKPLPRLVALAFVLASVLFMRDLSAVVLLAGFAVYVFARQTKWIRYAMIAAGIAAVIQLATMIDLDAPRVQMYLTYTERAMDVFARTSSEESLGMRYIIGAPFPFNFILRVPYTAIMPVPPFISTELPDIVRGSGALMWYFLFPFWIYGMWKSRRNPGANLLTTISLIFLLGISLVSIDLRHKTQYLALAMIHVSFAIHTLGETTRRVLVATFLVLGFLGISYGYLRFT